MVVRLPLEPAYGGVGDINDQPCDEARCQKDDANCQHTDGSGLLADGHVVPGFRLGFSYFKIVFSALDEFLKVGDVFLLGVALKHNGSGLRIVVDRCRYFLEKVKGRLCLPLEYAHDGGLRDIAGIGDILVAKIHGFALGVEVEEQLVLVYVGDFHKYHPSFLIVVHNASKLKRACFKIGAQNCKVGDLHHDLPDILWKCKEAMRMEVKDPKVIRMAMLLEELEEGPLRAAYMVISQMHELQTGKKKPADMGEMMRR